MVFVLVLIAAVTCGQTSQTPPRDAKATASTGTAVLAGRVVDAETGEPIARATVHISTGQIGVRPTELEANERGEFRLDGLGPGDYTIVASAPELRATHLPQVLGGDFASLATGLRRPSLQLKEAEVRDDLVVRLQRSLALEGTVLDESGEPMAGIDVSAELLDGLSLGTARSQPTDDRGMFRLFGLSPGSYRICANPRSDYLMGRPSSGDVVQQRYVKTCYPSSPAGGGERVRLSNAAAVPLLTVAMQRSTGYTLSGRATSESGATDISVHVRSADPVESASIPVEMQPGGRFIARGVTPGKYSVSANAAGRPTGPNSSVSTEMGRTFVEVTGSDVTGIEVTTSKGATLRGRIVAVEPLPPGTTIRVERAVFGVAMSMGSMGNAAPVRADLTFEMTGVHGEILFAVSGLPAGWVLSAVRYRGSDVTDTAVAVTSTSDASQLEVHISPRSGVVAARPIGEDGQPAKAAMAFVTPATGDRMFLLPPMKGRDPAGEAFELGPLRPGEYIVGAVALVDFMTVLRDPSRWLSLRESGRRIRVAAGERLAVDVIVRPVPEAKR